MDSTAMVDIRKKGKAFKYAKPGIGRTKNLKLARKLIAMK
jgi:hypothetical protein